MVQSILLKQINDEYFYNNSGPLNLEAKNI